MGDGLDDGKMPFRRPQLEVSIPGGYGESEGMGRGQTNIFGGHAQEPPKDNEGVLAGFEQTGRIIDGRVRVGGAQALMEGGEEVVMVVAVTVVGEDRSLKTLLKMIEGDPKARAWGSW
jgi:hypothetical protein